MSNTAVETVRTVHAGHPRQLGAPRLRPFSCVVQRPKRSIWTRLKMATFALLTIYGFVVAAPGLASLVGDLPAPDAATRDAAWSLGLVP